MKSIFLKNYMKINSLLCHLKFVKKFSFVNVKYKHDITNLLRNKEPLPNVQEFQNINEWDDKYGLSTINDHKLILSHLKKSGYTYLFSDLSYFLKRISEIIEEKNIEFDYRKDNLFLSFTNELKRRLRENDHETYPYIGSFAYALMKLKINDSELWELLSNKIKEDQFYTNFKEAVYAVEGFTYLINYKDQSYINEVYIRLERIIILTIWETNMINYKRIAESLVIVNRFGSEIFWKLENHIMNNLSMEYDIKTMIDILFAFSISKNGTKEFYDSMQYVLQKGHMFNKNPMLEYNIETPFSGHFISKIIEIYHKVNQKFYNFNNEPNFRVLLFKVLINKKTKYELFEINKCINYIDFLEFEDKKDIYMSFFNKILEIEHGIKFKDIIDFYEICASKGILNLLPKKCGEYFENYFIMNLKNQSLLDVCSLYDYFTERGILLNKEIVNKFLMEFINERIYSIQKFELELLIKKIQFNSKEQIKLNDYKMIKNYLLISDYQEKLADKMENKLIN